MSKKIPSPDDVALFRQVIGKVKPVKSDKKVHLGQTNQPRLKPKQTALDLSEMLDDSTHQSVENLGVEDGFAYAAPGIQKKILKQMRNGSFGLEAELDLHGLSAPQAKYQLLHFLHNCKQDGRRCVHIIHGKGYRSADQHPILKNKINQWLRQHQDVLAFCSASPRNGGSGVACILLRLSDKYREQDHSQK